MRWMKSCLSKSRSYWTKFFRFLPSRQLIKSLKVVVKKLFKQLSTFGFFIVALRLCNFLKKETLAHVFSCEICEIFKNTFFTEYLWTTASENVSTYVLVLQPEYLLLQLLPFQVSGYYKYQTLFVEI